MITHPPVASHTRRSTIHPGILNRRTSIAPLDRLSILINILQLTPSLGNRINRRLLRQDLPVGVLPDLSEFTPAGKVGRVSFVALHIWVVSVGKEKRRRRRGGGGEAGGGEGEVKVGKGTYVCLFRIIPVSTAESHVGCDPLLREIDDDGYHCAGLYHAKEK